MQFGKLITELTILLMNLWVKCLKIQQWTKSTPKRFQMKEQGLKWVSNCILSNKINFNLFILTLHAFS